MGKTYVTVSGDMWDLIAFRELGSVAHMALLMECNLRYREYYVFPAGVELVLPEVGAAVAAVEGLPPWKRGEG